MVRTGDIPYRLSLVASSPFTIMLPRRAIFCSGPQSVFPQEETRLQAQQHKAKLRNARLIPRESVTPVGDEYYSCICSEDFDPGLKAPRFGPVYRGLKPPAPSATDLCNCSTRACSHYPQCFDNECRVEDSKTIVPPRAALRPISAGFLSHCVQHSVEWLINCL